MTTRVTLTALLTVDFLGRIPAFALRQLANNDPRMPVALEFKIENSAWPKEVVFGCADASDAITFVREMAKDELKRRGESLAESPPASAAVDPHVADSGKPTTRVEGCS